MDNRTLQESKEALILLRSFPDGEISVENRALLDEKLSANTHRLKTEDKDHGLTGVPTTDLQVSELVGSQQLDAGKADQGVEKNELFEQKEFISQTGDSSNESKIEAKEDQGIQKAVDQVQHVEQSGAITEKEHANEAANESVSSLPEVGLKEEGKHSKKSGKAKAEEGK